MGDDDSKSFPFLLIIVLITSIACAGVWIGTAYSIANNYLLNDISTYNYTNVVPVPANCPVDERTKANVRVLVIGGGMGGHTAAYQLAKKGIGAANKPGPSGNTGVALIEATYRACGNIEDIVLPTDTPTAAARFGYCAQRVNIGTTPGYRCMMNELGIPLYFSPWHTEIRYSGRTSRNGRFNFGPDHNTCNGIDTPNPVYGSSNDGSSMLIGEANGGLPGGFSLPTWNQQGDPEDSGWGYLAGYPDYTNPTTGYDTNFPNRAYNDADTGEYDPNDPSQDHPRWQCAKFTSMYHLFSYYLGNEYAQFLCVANVGFQGDCFTGGVDPCMYLGYLYRAYNELDEGYPVPGLQHVCEKMEARVTSNFWNTDVQVTYSRNEPALSISHNPDYKASENPPAPRYVVTTPSRIIYADELLLNLSPFAVKQLTGDVAEALKAQPVLDYLITAETVTISIQWSDPWFSDLLQPLWGSYRLIAPQSCVNRLEIVKVPLRMNEGSYIIRGAYTDFICVKILMDLAKKDNPSFEEDQRPSSYPVSGFVGKWIMSEIRMLFPNYTIPDPIGVYLKYEEEAWWYARSGTPVPYEQFVPWAAQPLGPNERVAFAHGSFSLVYSGWAYSAINQTWTSLSALYPSEYPASYWNNYKTCNGRFIDDNSVLTGYNTPGLNTQYDYTNGMNNEFFPPYNVLNNNPDSVLYTPPATPTTPRGC